MTRVTRFERATATSGSLASEDLPIQNQEAKMWTPSSKLVRWLPLPMLLLQLLLIIRLTGE